ncbi:hypothetical protein ACRALDRAFT_2046213 [Sodiomyces alcalophilus JCM 7366]|uniref:uncharacterized protein n=1 Tax=Sodiomyces alcalophilus JCM 7366 TaxID=591952 RepID=UPI0039B37E00
MPPRDQVLPQIPRVLGFSERRPAPFHFLSQYHGKNIPTLHTELHGHGKLYRYIIIVHLSGRQVRAVSRGEEGNLHLSWSITNAYFGEPPPSPRSASDRLLEVLPSSPWHPPGNPGQSFFAPRRRGLSHLLTDSNCVNSLHSTLVLLDFVFPSYMTGRCLQKVYAVYRLCLRAVQRKTSTQFGFWDSPQKRYFSLHPPPSKRRRRTFGSPSVHRLDAPSRLDGREEAKKKKEEVGKKEGKRTTNREPSLPGFVRVHRTPSSHTPLVIGYRVLLSRSLLIQPTK